MFHLDRQEHCIRTENILDYGVEEDEDDDDDAEKFLISVENLIKINLQPNYIQRVHGLGQKIETGRNQVRSHVSRFGGAQYIFRGARFLLLLYV